MFHAEVIAECLNASTNGSKSTAPFSRDERKSVGVLVVSNDRPEFVNRLWEVVMAVSSQQFEQPREKMLA
jgi:hypothetical protein